jgi:hypothetical protein
MSARGKGRRTRRAFPAAGQPGGPNGDESLRDGSGQGCRGEEMWTIAWFRFLDDGKKINPPAQFGVQEGFIAFSILPVAGRDKE